jgi:hypothetical protein
METISFYRTDFGDVVIEDASITKGLRIRKNGDFDMRYKAAKTLVTKIKAHAQHVYMNSGDWDVDPIYFPPRS